MASDFSRTLALLRREKKISQRTAAGDLGVSQALLSHYENGLREPGLPFVVRAADYYGVDLEAAARELGGFTGYKGRQQILHIGGITVIDDSYNASPASMKAGIEVLHSLEGCRRKIAVLADMRELGPEAPVYHREVGDFAAGQNLDCLVLFGELAREIGTGVCGALEGVRMERNAWQDTSAEGFAHPPQIQLCKSLDEVKAWLDENLKEGDGVLFKGSNSMGLSQAVKHLLDRQKQEKKENE